MDGIVDAFSIPPEALFRNRIGLGRNMACCVVSAVTVVALIAVIFLRWPTPAIAGEKGNASRHQRRDEGDEDDFPHIYISHILGSVLALLGSISQTPLFICKGFTLIQ